MGAENMMFKNRFLMKWLSAAVSVVILMLTTPSARIAHAQEIGDHMVALDEAFVELVKSVFIFPVQESGNEPNFEITVKRAGEIVRTARQLPKLEDYKDDNGFANSAKKLERAGKALETFAQKKEGDSTASALVQLRAACLGCHQNSRF
jgi:hypothetical protein